MAERDPGDTRDPKRALIAAGLITAGFLGFALTGKQHTVPPGKLKLTEPLEKKAPPAHDGRKNHLKIAKIEGLKIGGELTDVPVLTVEHQAGHDYKYVPSGDKPAEDLVVVYSSSLDRILKERDRERFGDGAGSFSTAFLFTSVPGGVMESLVAFNGKTKVVKDIYSGPGGLLPEEPVPLYDYGNFSPSKVGFTMDIEQIPSANGHGVELSVHGTPPEHSSAA